MTLVALSPTEKLREKLQVKSPLIRNLLSEFFGTALLLFIGIGIVIQFDLPKLGGKVVNTWIQINVGWGFAITFAVYATAKTSGGHLNPAVSLVMYTFGRLSLPHLFLYSLVQTAGAFVGAALSYLVYVDQFSHYVGALRAVTGVNATAGCFCSFPPAYLSNTGAFFDQVAGTGLLALVVAVVVDKRNQIPDVAHPLLFGFLVMMIGTAYGMNLGYPINPARDLGPRILTAFLYGPEVFSYHNYYFWIPVIAPLFGAVLGAWLYHFFVGFHIPDTKPVVYLRDLQNASEIPLKNGEDA